MARAIKKPSRKTKPANPAALVVVSSRAPAHESSFREVVEMIEAARSRAYHAVNNELIDLYWRIGEFISRQITAAGWGKNTVSDLSQFIRARRPGISGFSASNLWRMRQFHDMYVGQPKLAALLRELNWTQNLLILARAKRPEEREFYLRLCAREKWPSRELERQLAGALFERIVLSPAKLSPLVRQLHVRKPHERPSIGVLLCATKDHEVVEYALARSASPALIAEYQTALPDKQLLRRKLHEFYQLALPHATPAPRTRRQSPKP